MKINISLVLISCLILFCGLVHAQPPEHDENDWEAYLISKLGFSADGLSEELLANMDNITDADFDFVKELDSPVWAYCDYNSPVTPHAESIGTVDGIPVGEYYVHAFGSEVWIHRDGNWQLWGNNFWMPHVFSLNGIFRYRSDDSDIISLADLIKVTIGNNKNTVLSQTLTNVNSVQPYPTTIIDYTFTAVASDPE